MDFSKTFSSDENLEEEGVWEFLGGDSALLIARAGNQRYGREWRKLPDAVKAQIENDVMPEDESLKIFCDLMAKSILLDWKDMTDEGMSVAYTEKTASAMLQKYRNLREFVWKKANEQKRFKSAAQQADSKNFSDASNGT